MQSTWRYRFHCQLKLMGEQAPNMAVKGTACKLRLQVPSAFGSGRPLPLR